MEAERRKSIVAALLAVHSGRISPDQAARFLEDPGKVQESLRGLDGGVPVITLSGGNGEAGQYDLLAVVEDEEKSRRALAEIGIEERAQDTLFSFGAQGGTQGMTVLRDALTAVAGSGARLTQSDMKAGSEPRPGSENPTQPPKEDTRALRLTTDRFLPNFGVSAERYDVRKEHARGGMGRVLLVRDKAIGRDIAMKELLPGVGSSHSIPAGGSGSGGVIERFLREAKITGQLEHPNIVPVYEIGKHSDNSVYYTMRFVRGMTLAEKLREIRKDESLDRKQRLAARITLLDRFLDICDAISYAHSKGVIHRDLKPENIMLGEYGETLVLDWGLARVKGQEDKALRELQKGSMALSRSLVESDSQNLTQDGSIVGTPAYMPPEQARGELEQVDEQSDVYALGAVLYQLLCGSPPYEGPMAGLIVQQVLAGPPLRLTAREPDVPPELGALVEKAMAREKADRMRTVRELATEIKAFRDGRTLGVYSYSAREMIARFVRQHRTAVSIGVLAALILAAGAIVAWQQVTRERDDARAAHQAAETQRLLAQANLDRAEREKTERERLEKEAIRRAEEELKGRLGDVRRLRATIEGMRVDQILADLAARNGQYEAQAAESGQPFLELGLEERTGNGVLLSSIMGYVSSQQNLMDLLSGPAGAALPEELRHIDLVAGRLELQTVRLAAARLATFNGDFPLAELMLSGVEDAAARQARASVESARAGLLALHGRRIDEALYDVRADLRREGRPAGAPRLDDYVRLLSSYRERETVARLAEPARELRLRCLNPLFVWQAADLDVARLVCRVLGAMEQPKETVPLLAQLLDAAGHPVIVREAAGALCATKSAEAIDPLLAQARRRGLDFWKQVESGAGRLPLSERLRHPQGVEDWVDRSILLLARGDTDGAIEAAGRAAVLDAASIAPLLARAMARHRKGDQAGAMADFDAVLTREPRNFDAWLARGDARDFLADGDKAIEDYTAAINLRPTDARGYLRRGAAYGRRYAFDQAFGDYENALRLDPRRIESFIEYGELLFRRGRWPEAEKQFTAAIELEPDNWLGWHHRGVVRREFNFPGSIQDLTRSTELNPNDAKGYNWMSQSYFGMSQFLDGIRAATRAVEINPDEWLAYYYRGITYLQLQDAEDARLGQAPRDGNAAIARDNMLTRAADDFGAASRINPRDFRSAALQGQTLLRLERFEDAREAYMRALALSPFGAGTLQMGNEFVKAGLLEIEGQPLLARAAASTDERILKARAHLGRQVRHAGHRNADLRQARAELRVLRAAAARGELGVKQQYRYEQVENLFFTTLAGHSLWEEYVDELDDLEARRGLSGAEVFLRAGARLNLRQAILTRSLKLLGADETALATRQAEYAGLSDEQVLRRGSELLDAVLADLHTAFDEGWSDAGAIRRDTRFAPLAGNREFVELLQRMDAAGVRHGPQQAESEDRRVAVITNVIEYSPASRFGLKPFDVITHVNGTRVRTTQEMQAAMTRVPEGGDLEFTIRRYVLVNGQPAPRRNPDGSVARDARGLCQWDYTEVRIAARRGFLGINLENGTIPRCEEE